MTDESDGPFTLAFVGYAAPEASERAGAYEDAVLPLLADHGAELVFRGRRAAGQDAGLPLEVQLIRFPHRDALASYLADDRRAALVDEFGDVFTATQVVEVETVAKPPPTTVSQVWADDTRAALPLVGDERQILTSYLDWHRRTFELKCAGVPRERLSEKGIPPSGLSLHGLARHLAGVERWWFRIQFAGEHVPLLYYSDDDPNQDFDRLDGDVDEVLPVWRAECDRSRAIVAAAPSLDDTGTHAATGNPVSLRRVLVHLIAEYARHNGHADLLRERIDGATGL